jgi:hypothetical protein
MQAHRGVLNRVVRFLLTPPRAAGQVKAPRALPPCTASSTVFRARAAIGKGGLRVGYVTAGEVHCLTLVAVGIWLPELVTSAMAAVRRHANVAFGHILGSSIFKHSRHLGACGGREPGPGAASDRCLRRLGHDRGGAAPRALRRHRLAGRTLGGRRLPGRLRGLPARPAYADLPGMARARVRYQALATRTSQGAWRSRSSATLPSAA